MKYDLLLFSTHCVDHQRQLNHLHNSISAERVAIMVTKRQCFIDSLLFIVRIKERFNCKN